MKIICLQLFAVLLLCSACSKSKEFSPTQPALSKSTDFTLFTIKQGEHYVANNNYKPIEISELKFSVQFDSSAIYKTTDPVNQYDINKLYGFSDNNAMHHQYSARFGWSWNEKALRLYAYVYNEEKVVMKELGPISIGNTYQCSIKVESNQYIFAINDSQTSIPRSSTTTKAKGYLLYPYFGGDEVAPQDIYIRIKDL